MTSQELIKEAHSSILQAKIKLATLKTHAPTAEAYALGVAIKMLNEALLEIEACMDE